MLPDPSFVPRKGDYSLLNSASGWKTMEKAQRYALPGALQEHPSCDLYPVRLRRLERT